MPEMEKGSGPRNRSLNAENNAVASAFSKTSNENIPVSSTHVNNFFDTSQENNSSTSTPYTSFEGYKGYILDHFQDVKRNGNPDQAQANCPVCADTGHHLYIKFQDNKALLHCHRGCDIKDICTFTGLSLADLHYKEPTSRTNNGRVIVAEYDYQSADGTLLFQTVRYNPKDFRQRQPGTVKPWIWTLKGIQTVIYHLPDVIQGVASGETIYIVEGEKDADKLKSLGLCATCNPMGAGKWKGYYSPYLQSASVVIIPDNDQPGREHAADVAMKLKDIASSIRILELPNLPLKGDVSDWIAQGHGKEDILSRVAAAPIWQPETVTIDPNSNKVESIPDNRYSLINVRSTEWVSRLAEALLSETSFAHYKESDVLYVYKDGVYRGNGKEYITQRVMSILKEIDKSHIWTTHRTSEIIGYIMAQSDMPLLKDRPEIDVVNVKNGLLDLRTGELKPHSPSFLSEVQLPVIYNPKAKCDEWEKFVKSTFPEDAHELAWEIAGWLIVPDNRLKKAVMCLGEGNNGKSVYLAGLTALLGEENVSTISLQSLESDRFSRVNIVGKLANICADLPASDLVSSSTFKQITGGDRISVERKFCNQFSYLPYVRFIFSANRPPKTPDSSEAFFSRWLPIRFPYEFSDELGNIDKSIKEKLTTPEELSGLLNKAMYAWRDLQDRGDFNISASIKEAADEFRATTDPFTVWLKSETVEHPTAWVRKVDLYNKYKTDANTNGWDYLTPNGFSRIIKKILPKVSDRARRFGEDVERCWFGIGLATDHLSENITVDDVIGSFGGNIIPE